MENPPKSLLVNIPLNVHIALKTYAAAHQVTMTKVILDALYPIIFNKEVESNAEELGIDITEWDKHQRLKREAKEEKEGKNNP